MPALSITILLPGKRENNFAIYTTIPHFAAKDNTVIQENLHIGILEEKYPQKAWIQTTQISQ